MAIVNQYKPINQTHGSKTYSQRKLQKEPLAKSASPLQWGHWKCRRLCGYYFKIRWCNTWYGSCFDRLGWLSACQHWSCWLMYLCSFGFFRCIYHHNTNATLWLEHWTWHNLLVQFSPFTFHLSPFLTCPFSSFVPLMAEKKLLLPQMNARASLQRKCPPTLQMTRKSPGQSWTSCFCFIHAVVLVC